MAGGFLRAIILATLCAAPLLADSAGEAKAEFRAGISAQRQGDLQQARAHLSRAYELVAQEPAARWQQAACLEALGMVEGQLGRQGEKTRLVSRALELYLQVDGTEWERGNCLAALAVAGGALGRDDEAADLAAKALALYRQVDDTAWERANCLSILGVCRRHQGRYQESLEALEAAVALYETCEGTERERAACHLELGMALGSLGELTRKVQVTERALALFEAIPGSLPDQAACLQNLGTAHAGLGDHEQAIRCAELALAILRSVPGSELRQGQCQANLAVSRGAMGDAGEQISVLEQALGLLEAGHAPQASVADCRTNLGLARLESGRTAEGLADLLEAERQYLAGAETSSAGPRVPPELYRVEMGIGRALRRRDLPEDPWAAYRHYARAARLTEYARPLAATSPLLRSSYSARSAWACDELIDLLCEMREAGLSPVPAKLREQSPGFWRSLGLPVPELWADEQSWEEAIWRASEEARGRSVREALLSPSSEGAAPVDDPWERLGRLEARHGALEQSLAEAEVAGDGVRADGLRAQLAAIIEQAQAARAQLGDCLPGRVAEPPIVDLAAAQTMVPAGAALLVYKLLPRSVLILTLLPDAVHLRLVPVHGGADEPLFGRGHGAPLQFLALRLLDALSRDECARQGAPSDAGLPVPPEVLRQRFTVSELVWLLRRPMVQMGEDDEPGRLEAAASRAQQLCIAAALYDVLLRPVREHVEGAGVKRLIVVPDGALHYLPFAMLADVRDPEAIDAPASQCFAAPEVTYALERWSLSYLPSVSVGAVVQEVARSRPTPSQRVCVFADPVFSRTDGRLGARSLWEAARREADPAVEPAPVGDLRRLPATRREALAVLQAFSPAGELTEAALQEDPDRVLWEGSLALVSRAATEELLRAPRLADYGYVHLSTHAVVDPQRPERSFLALSLPPEGAPEEADGRLTLAETLELRLNARLVTLSACRTAEGRLDRGEGMLGMSAAWLVAGTRAVAAGLWTVDDESTADLMGACQRGLAGGAEPADALRLAQLESLARSRVAFEADPSCAEAARSHPYYWAPFVVTGL